MACNANVIHGIGLFLDGDLNNATTFKKTNTTYKSNAGIMVSSLIAETSGVL